MSQINDGGAAFPCDVIREEKYMDEGGYGHTRRVKTTEGGMTLRDWLAGQVDVSVYKPVEIIEKHEGRQATVKELAECIAGIRYMESDAMIAERSKGGEG